MEMREPITTTFGVNEGDDKVEFPAVTRGLSDTFVLVPREYFEVVQQTDKTIILRQIPRV